MNDHPKAGSGSVRLVGQAIVPADALSARPGRPQSRPAAKIGCPTSKLTHYPKAIHSFRVLILGRSFQPATADSCTIKAPTMDDFKAGTPFQSFSTYARMLVLFRAGHELIKLIRLTN